LGHVWVYVVDDEYVVFRYTARRKSDGLAKNKAIQERDTGSETGINKGQSFTRDACFSADFVNPGPTEWDTRRRHATPAWATSGQRRGAQNRQRIAMLRHVASTGTRRARLD
jgi:hypothetical protein